MIENREKLRTSLAQAIDKWIQKECEKTTWDGVGFVHDSLNEQMANAAFAVLDTVSINQAFLKRDGYAEF